MLLIVLLLPCSAVPTPIQLGTDGGLGLRFDGIGAISGGGASDKRYAAYSTMFISSLHAHASSPERLGRIVVPVFSRDV